MNSQRRDKITAVIVTYQPELEGLLKNIELTHAQVDHLVVVDNGSKNQHQLSTSIDQAKQSLKNLSLICLEENQGLGAAHNAGIAQARKFASTFEAQGFVLLMDQDSQPQANMVTNLYVANQQLLRKLELQKSQPQTTKPQTTQLQKPKHSEKIAALAAVGPRYVGQTGLVDSAVDSRNDSFFVKFGYLKFKRFYCDCDINLKQQACSSQNKKSEKTQKAEIIPADFLISSGSLISLQALDVIGNMDEGLFIDHVDTEWFLRAKKQGYQSYGVCNAVMQHGLGEQTRTVKLFGVGRERHVPQHQSFRYYYMFRNSIHLYKRGYSKLWMWNDMQRLLQIMIFYGVIYGPRLQNLAMMLRGVKDGLVGRVGKLD